jgi:hypothetical protein
VFLITMRGHFTAREATGPPGAKAPTGRYLSLVIDAKTFQGLDFGIGPKPPPVLPAASGRLPISPATTIDKSPEVTTLRDQHLTRFRHPPADLHARGSVRRYRADAQTRPVWTHGPVRRLAIRLRYAAPRPFTAPWGFKSVFMEVRVGSVGRQAWFRPLSDSGPAAALDGRQRFCTSERIRPIRLLKINIGPVAHRAMWGYGVDPPADINPHLGLVPRVSPRSGRHCSRRRPSWVLMALYPGVSALLNRLVPRGVELAFAHQLCRQDCAGNGSFLTSPSVPRRSV